MTEGIAVKFDKVSAKCKGFWLSDINFELPAGYICGLTGKNGAGKTSMLKLLVERKAAYKGSITMLDRERRPIEIRKERSVALDNIGFVTDEHNFVKKMSARANVDMFSPFYSGFDRELFDSKQKQYGVSQSVALSDLSRGERLKFQLAFAIAHKPSLYLFDEVTAGMDVVFRKEFFREIRGLMLDGKTTVVLATNLREELEDEVDYICSLEKGRMISFSEKVS